MGLGVVLIGWMFGVVAAMASIYLSGVGWGTAFFVFIASGSFGAVVLMTVAAAREGLLQQCVSSIERDADTYWNDVACDVAWTKAAAQRIAKEEANRAA